MLSGWHNYPRVGKAVKGLEEVACKECSKDPGTWPQNITNSGQLDYLRWEDSVCPVLAGFAHDYSSPMEGDTVEYIADTCIQRNGSPVEKGMQFVVISLEDVEWRWCQSALRFLCYGVKVRGDRSGGPFQLDSEDFLVKISWWNKPDFPEQHFLRNASGICPGCRSATKKEPCSEGVCSECIEKLKVPHEDVAVAESATKPGFALLYFTLMPKWGVIECQISKIPHEIKERQSYKKYIKAHKSRSVRVASKPCSEGERVANSAPCAPEPGCGQPDSHSIGAGVQHGGKPVRGNCRPKINIAEVAKLVREARATGAEHAEAKVVVAEPKTAEAASPEVEWRGVAHLCQTPPGKSWSSYSPADDTLPVPNFQQYGGAHEVLALWSSNSHLRTQLCIQQSEVARLCALNAQAQALFNKWEERATAAEMRNKTAEKAMASAEEKSKAAEKKANRAEEARATAEEEMKAAEAMLVAALQKAAEATLEKNAAEERAAAAEGAKDAAEQKAKAGEKKTNAAEEARTAAEKKGDKESRSVCVICLEGASDHACIPCGHQCLCETCKTNFMGRKVLCPMCRGRVRLVVKVFPQ